MYRIDPFIPDHYRKLVPLKEDKLTYLNQEQVISCMNEGRAWTIIETSEVTISRAEPFGTEISDLTDRPLAIAGIRPVLPGVGEAWIIVDQSGIGKPVIMRSVRRLLPRTVRALGLHRLQAICHVERTISQRWLGWLGFENEGVMRCYGPDRSDYIRFSLINTESV